MAETDATEDNYIASKDLPITFKVSRIIINFVSFLSSSFWPAGLMRADWNI